MGKGKTSDAQAAQEHVSRPLATLKDPSSFGPPPKNVNYHGGAALPNEITPHRGGWGAPLSEHEIASASRAVQSPQVEEEEAAKPAPPSLPYRADRTGLRTDNLPPPPVHRDLNKAAATPPPPPSTRSPAPATQPRLPPRLPSRQNTVSPPVSEPPPPSYDAVASNHDPSPAASPATTQPSYINQAAANRLGQAGVSIPAFNIGGQTDSNPWQSEKSQARPATTNNYTSELQSRFSKLTTQQSSPAASQAPQASEPASNAIPSWKQSQSAFTTAQNLRTNPQNVSLADAQAAAQTAGQVQRSTSAFREKHGPQIAAAQTKAKAWDQKHKFTSKLNKFLDEHTEPENPDQQANAQQPQSLSGQPGQQFQAPTAAASSYSPAPQLPTHPSTSASQATQPSAATELAASIARKPPPPPAPRKPANLQAPPPVPMGTKPSFG